MAYSRYLAIRTFHLRGGVSKVLTLWGVYQYASEVPDDLHVFFSLFWQVDTSIIDYTCNVQELKGVSRAKVAATLAEVGFSEEGQAAPIVSLSGGWKMKLALARAMLQEAQVSPPKTLIIVRCLRTLSARVHQFIGHKEYL